ncbi:MAG: 30S ribosomal protein S8e [Candidatus Aenigmatarchaeota archaeon]
MAVWHGEKGRKATGGIIKLARKKRKYELGSLPIYTKLGKDKKVLKRTKGGGKKLKAYACEYANVIDTANKVVKKVKILDVIENPANPHFVRRKIITRGAIIKTELGNAKVTSRPGQDGVVNAILISEKQKE